MIADDVLGRVVWKAPVDRASRCSILQATNPLADDLMFDRGIYVMSRF